MDTEPLDRHKPTFLELFTQSKLDISTLNELTGIPRSTLRLMLMAEPMPRPTVYKALSALSTQLHQDYTLNDVDFPLIPSFSQMLETLNIIPSDLARNAKVSESVLALMIEGRPVFQEYAEQVLSEMSAMVKVEQEYTLKNVDVNILMMSIEVSEVARIKREMEETYTAAKRGLTGLAEGTSKHSTITHRMEEMTNHIQTLESLVGEQEAIQFMQQLGE